MPEIYIINPKDTGDPKWFAANNARRTFFEKTLSSPVIAKLLSKLLEHAHTLELKNQKEVLRLLDLKYEKDVSLLKSHTSTQEHIQGKLRSVHFFKLLNALSVVSISYEKPTEAQQKSLEAKLGSADYNEAVIDAWLKGVAFNGGALPALATKAETTVTPNPVFYAHYFWQVDTQQLRLNLLKIDFSTKNIAYYTHDGRVYQHGTLSHIDKHCISFQLYLLERPILAAQYLLQVHGNNPLTERAILVGTFAAMREDYGLGVGAVLLLRLQAKDAAGAQEEAHSQHTHNTHLPAISHYLLHRRFSIPFMANIEPLTKLSESHARLASFAGRWQLWSANSLNTALDVFPITIYDNGTFEGHIPIMGDIKYTGSLEYSNECLYLHFKKAGDTPHFVTYIFKVYLYDPKAITRLFGITAGIAHSNKLLPMARAVVLQRETDPIPFRHINWDDTEELSALESQVSHAASIIEYIKNKTAYHLTISDSPVLKT